MTQEIEILRCEDGGSSQMRKDEVAVEEPLEIRVEGHVVAIAMRTPGYDRELAAGWAWSEGVVKSAREIADIVTRPGEEAQRSAMVDVMLRDPGQFEVEKHRRNVITHASCGLCGAASIEQVLRAFPKLEGAFQMEASVLYRLPERLQAQQRLFQKTGGVHACALFDSKGELLALREDVGRHNALDKLVGWALLAGRVPLAETILLLSGRASFEMVQKALAAGIPMIAAIGAPSSLAVELARNSGQCMAAFLRRSTLNVYAGLERLRGAGGL